MPFERANPIPRGIYWIDLIGMRKVLNFASWKGSNRSTVKVLKRKERSFDDHWVLFEVTKPTKRWRTDWKLGLPTIARKGKTTTEKSTGKVPKVKQTTELLSDWGDTVKSTLQSGFALVAIAYILANRRR